MYVGPHQIQVRWLGFTLRNVVGNWNTIYFNPPTNIVFDTRRYVSATIQPKCCDTLIYFNIMLCRIRLFYETLTQCWHISTWLKHSAVVDLSVQRHSSLLAVSHDPGVSYTLIEIMEQYAWSKPYHSSEFRSVTRWPDWIKVLALSVSHHALLHASSTLQRMAHLVSTLSGSIKVSTLSGRSKWIQNSVYALLGPSGQGPSRLVRTGPTPPGRTRLATRIYIVKNIQIIWNWCPRYTNYVQIYVNTSKYMQGVPNKCTKYHAAAGLAHAGRARAGPGPARRWAWARPAAAWYFVLILYILWIWYI